MSPWSHLTSRFRCITTSYAKEGSMSPRGHLTSRFRCITTSYAKEGNMAPWSHLPTRFRRMTNSYVKDPLTQCVTLHNTPHLWCPRHRPRCCHRRTVDTPGTRDFSSTTPPCSSWSSFPPLRSLSLERKRLPPCGASCPQSQPFSHLLYRTSSTILLTTKDSHYVRQLRLVLFSFKLL